MTRNTSCELEARGHWRGWCSTHDSSMDYSYGNCSEAIRAKERAGELILDLIARVEVLEARLNKMLGVNDV